MSAINLRTKYTSECLTCLNDDTIGEGLVSLKTYEEQMEDFNVCDIVSFTIFWHLKKHLDIKIPTWNVHLVYL